MSIRMTNVLHERQAVDVLIEGNRFVKIEPSGTQAWQADETIDGKGMAIMPPFYNAHTHAAMTLLRGIADDLALFDWLNNHIWPAEGRMTAEDVRAGNRLAMVEMIKSGSVFFNDMYWYPETAVEAAEEFGLRACVCSLFLDGVQSDPVSAAASFEKLAAVPHSSRIQIGLGPHAVYTVAPDKLKFSAKLSQDTGALVHIHLAETKQEVEDCLKAHGKTPVQLLESCGLLGPKTIAVHCVHLTAEDIALLKATDTVLVHAPCSNMKLASGVFPWQAVRTAGCRIALGTDGASSNNNLDMREEMKFAALLAKVTQGDPTACPAGDILTTATRDSAQAFDIDAGEIAVGKLADCLLVDLNNSRFVADHCLTSNMVYSAESSSIDTVICDGRVLMRGRHVPGEEEVLATARTAARRLANQS